jgi:hypothetical protein
VDDEDLDLAGAVAAYIRERLDTVYGAAAWRVGDNHPTAFLESTSIVTRDGRVSAG